MLAQMMWGFPTRAPSISVSFVASATGTSTITVPPATQAGDVIFIYNTSESTSGLSYVVPAGYTSILQSGDGTNYRAVWSYKIAKESDAGSSVSLMEINSVSRLVVFRPSKAGVSVSISTVNSFVGLTKPTNQTVNASAASAPLVVLSGNRTENTTTAPLTLSPAADSIIPSSTEPKAIAYKIYNNSPQDVAVSQNDGGNGNILTSFFARFVDVGSGSFSFSSGAVAASGVNVSSLTVALPADIQAGDLLFCHGLIQHATAAGSISGWTNQSVPGDYGTYSFVTATGSESGNVTVNLSVAARCTAVITRVRHSSGITPKVSRYVSGVYASNPTVTLAAPPESHFSVAHLIDYWKDTTFSLSGLNSNMSQLAQRTDAPAHYSGVIQTSALGLTGSTVGVTTATSISAIANAVYV